MRKLFHKLGSHWTRQGCQLFSGMAHWDEKLLRHVGMLNWDEKLEAAIYLYTSHGLPVHIGDALTMSEN